MFRLTGIQSLEGRGILPHIGYTGMCRSTGYGFCLSEPGAGSTNQRSCLELGILFSHSDSGTWSGLGFLFFLSESHCKQTLLFSGPLHVYSNTGFEGQPRLTIVEQGIYFYHLVWSRVAKLFLTLVWNRVRFPGTQWHTPILN